MRILFVVSEALPYVKTGGLADVGRALPDALAGLGHEVRILHPLYRPIRDRRLPLEPVGAAELPWPTGPVPVRYLEHRPPTGAPALLVEAPGGFFDVDDPYAAPPGDPLAPGIRFALFCRAALERARAWGADVVHLNDWPTGLVPAYARLQPPWPPTAFAIHNLAYQGNFPPAILPRIGLGPQFLRAADALEFFGQASFLKAGIALADQLVTVSPTYAREIQTPEFGAGLDGLLRQRRHVLHGILNGIDTRTWDPATDPALPAPYDAARLEAKETDRALLLRELGLDDDGPLLVAVGRLAHQKGYDLLLEALPALLQRPLSLAILGRGEPALEDALARAADHHPRRIAALLRFDDPLAHRLYAGGDFFVMPSRYEPCGLGQMIAQRYGTPPIVRHTGGLVDTVRDGETGFAFHTPTADALAQAVRRATDEWRGPRWDELRRRCMALDWSWTGPAARYEHVYRLAIQDTAARPVLP